MTQRAVPGAAVAAALLCLALPARADKETIALDYEAGAGCPDKKQFVERVHTFTTKAELVSDDGAPRRKFGVQVLRIASSVRGELTIDDRGVKTTRSVSGATCDEVISALALATAIAVDPDALGGAAPGEPSKPQPDAPAATAKPPEGPRPPKPPRASPPHSLPAGVKPSVDEAPPHALYLSAGGRLADAIAPFPKLEASAQLGVTYFAPAELNVGAALGPRQENAQVGFSDWVAWFGIGYRLFDLEPFSMSIQGAFEYGQVEAIGREIVPARSVRRPWSAVDVGLSGRVNAPGPLFFQANIGGRAPLTLQRYVVTENNGKSQEVHQVGQLGYLLGLSVGAYFL